MNAILGYILSNYTWILFGSIIILLAIIGWYADKTNFGQGKSYIENKQYEEPTVEDLKKQLGDKKLLDEINGTNQEIFEENVGTELIQGDIQLPNIENDIVIEQPSKPEVENIQISGEMNFDPMTGEPLNGNVGVKQVIADKDNMQIGNLDNYSSVDLDDFEKKFNQVIPEKEIIDEGLLEDIEDLTLDKTQKINLNDIPDLDDVELPRIKKIRTNDEGIWKF